MLGREKEQGYDLIAQILINGHSRYVPLRPAINVESVYNDVGPCQDWEVFFFSRNLFSATKVRCSNRSMEPFQFNQPSIRSRPVSGP